MMNLFALTLILVNSWMSAAHTEMATNSCARLLSNAAAHFYTTAGADSDASNAYLGLLDLTLKGIDEAEAHALAYISRDTLKTELLQVIANSATAVDPIAALQKLAPGLADHSPQLIAMRISELFGPFIESLSTGEQQSIRQAITQKLAQLKASQEAQAEAKPVTEDDYVDMPDAEGDVRLHRLIRARRFEEAIKLLQNPKLTTRYINTRNRNGDSPLQILNTLLNQSVYDLMAITLQGIMIEKDAADNNTLATYDKELHFGAYSGGLRLIKSKYNLGANLEFIAGQQHFTPLFVAINQKKEDAVEMLLELGADVDAQNVYGQTIMDSAISYLSKPTLELLFRDHQPKNFKQIGERKISGLARGGIADVIDLLIRYGIDKHLLDTNGVPLAHNVINSYVFADQRPSTIKTLQVLAKHNYDFELRDTAGDTPLQMAKKMGYLEVVEELIRLGAKPE